MSRRIAETLFFNLYLKEGNIFKRFWTRLVSSIRWNIRKITETEIVWPN